MTPAGKTVELTRYRIPNGERALQAQRIDGRVTVIDVPADPRRPRLPRRAPRPQPSRTHGLVTEYAQRSEACGVPAILATLQSANDLLNTLA